MSQKRALLVVMSLLLWAVLTTALSTAFQATKATPLTPHPAGGDSHTLSDQHFYLEWTVSPARDDQSNITGYVYNDSRDPVDNVQLRITEFDTSDRVLWTTVRTLGEPLPAGERTTFGVQVPTHGSSSYQVTIDAFEFSQAS